MKNLNIFIIVISLIVFQSQSLTLDKTRTGAISTSILSLHLAECYNGTVGVDVT